MGLQLGESHLRSSSFRCLDHTAPSLPSLRQLHPPAAIHKLCPSRPLTHLLLLPAALLHLQVVIKDSEAYFDPYAFSFLRFAVAAAAFSPFLKAASADKRIVTGGIELGLWTAAGYLLQSQGLITTDASRASFLSTFTVIIVPILAGLSGRGVQPLTWFSAVAALIGMSLLEGGGAPPCVGDVWSFLSAIAFGVQVGPGGTTVLPMLGNCGFVLDLSQS